jgi:HTH-type transcriptional repressor of NAD biosynthesis genes
MIKAFVFGKFLPFHKGHEAMIRFALTKCDFLTVLICCSDKEKVTNTIRKNWIESTFKETQNIEVRVFNYLESDLPNTSVPSSEVSKIWSETFKTLFPDYDLVITSEEYGNYIADFMEIKHISFDNKRNKIPVSATSIRQDLFKNWNFLPDSVKPFFAIKIIILGTESTGKTVLSEKLAKHYNCSIVAEAGRELVENSNSFQFETLPLIASEHSKRINDAVLGENPLIIIDTDIHITKSYSKFTFAKELNVNDDIYNSNKGELYIYLNNDVKYIQDGTRLNEADRNLLDFSHREILRQFNIAFVEINGNWNQRFEKAVNEINQLILANKNKHRV